MPGEAEIGIHPGYHVVKAGEPFVIHSFTHNIGAVLLDSIECAHELSYRTV